MLDEVRNNESTMQNYLVKSNHCSSEGHMHTIPNINKLGFTYDRNIKQFFEGNFWHDATK